MYPLDGLAVLVLLLPLALAVQKGSQKILKLFDQTSQALRLGW